MIKGLIFDIGGVLAHDVWENLLLNGERSLATKMGWDSERVCALATKLWREFAYRSTKKENEWQALEVEYWNRFIKDLGVPQSAEFFIKLTDEFIRPVPGMIDLLELLYQKGINLAICSNNTEFWFARQMAGLNLSRFFKPNSIILSSRVGVSKASSDFRMFEAAVASLALPKSECLLVDDRDESVLRSVEFGVTAVIFPSHSERGAEYLKSLLKKFEVL